MIVIVQEDLVVGKLQVRNRGIQLLPRRKSWGNCISARIKVQHLVVKPKVEASIGAPHRLCKAEAALLLKIRCKIAKVVSQLSVVVHMIQSCEVFCSVDV